MPVDPGTIAAIIGAGGRLLGGLGGKSSGAVTNDNIRNLAGGARRWGEKYGFNPITLLGASGNMVGQATGPTMGQSIADAALVAADWFNGKSDAMAEIDRLKAANEKLAARLTSSVITPRVASPVYGPDGISGIGNGFTIRAGSVFEGPAQFGFPTPAGDGKPVPDDVPFVQGGHGPSTSWADGDIIDLDQSLTGIDYLSKNQRTKIPQGPDIDEILSGIVIDTWHSFKAAAARAAAAGPGNPVPGLRGDYAEPYEINLTPSIPVKKGQGIDLGAWPMLGWNPLDKAYRY